MLLQAKKRCAALVLLLGLPLSGCTDLPAALSVASATKPSINLDWKEFYQFPVGPKGLEPSAKLLSLANQRVRLRGYWVQEEEPEAGMFMLAPLPVDLAEKEDGPADDLPPSTVFVHLPANERQTVLSHRPGLWELEGKLVLGNQDEAGGRVSYVRLMLD